MILQRLVEHYDRIAREAGLALPGFSQQKISFCIVLEPDGRLNSFDDLRRADGNNLRPRAMQVPGQSKPPGSGFSPCFLWDSPEYLLGFSLDPKKQERAPAAFKAARSFYLAQEVAIASPHFSAVCRFLESWTPEQVQEHLATLTECATNFGIFRIAGEQKYIHELIVKPVIVLDPSQALTKVDQPASSTMKGMCLITGEMTEIARLHEPAIKGVNGANTMGAKLVCFDKDAFTSYDKDQSRNAPVSLVATFKYTNALNHLLEQRDRRIGLGDATVVFWADQPEPVLEDVFAMLCGSLPGANEETAMATEDNARVDQARLLLSQLRDGTRRMTIAPGGQATKFYILGLSPNASRLSVRLWIEAAAPVLERRLSEHLRDLDLKSSSNERVLSLRTLANATGRYQSNGNTKFDTKGVSFKLVGELARSVLTGVAYPHSFLATMIRRIRNDNYSGYERVSAIKACLNRNSRLRGAPQEMPVQLDDQETDVAYRCGRLFALLEKAQLAALGKDLNSTLKDRFFAAASATPALIFPRLFRVNTYHLAKLTQGTKHFYTNAFGDLMKEPFTFPRQLSLEQQGRFFIGYFQERQYRPAANTPEETANTNE